jgi:hypothetical protein
VIRICTRLECQRAFVVLDGEPEQGQCPTCRAGMKPLSTLRGLPKKREEKPLAAKS